MHGIHVLEIFSTSRAIHPWGIRVSDLAILLFPRVAE